MHTHTYIQGSCRNGKSGIVDVVRRNLLIKNWSVNLPFWNHVNSIMSRHPLSSENNITSRVYTKWHNSQLSRYHSLMTTAWHCMYWKGTKWAFLKSWKYITDETVYCKSGFPWGVNSQKRQVYPTRFCCHIIPLQEKMKNLKVPIFSALYALCRNRNIWYRHQERARLL